MRLPSCLSLHPAIRHERPALSSLAALATALALAWPAAASAQERPAWEFDRAFLQLGMSADTKTAVVGLASDFWWHHDFASGTLMSYWEAAAGRWHIKEEDQTTEAWITQVGATPVLRWRPAGSNWFGEAGIGVNALFPVFKDSERRFSTVFEFGDHLAVGLRFGEAQQHELALRIEHFSNGGGKEPNPGDNFVQLRYSHPF